MTRSLSLSLKAFSFPVFSILISLLFIFVTNAFGQTPAPGELKRDSQKVKVCEVKEKNIKNRFSSLSDLVKNMVEKFDAIATRVQLRYTEKLVPAGKTISNYDALVADINTKKTAVGEALAKASTTASEFSCDASSDPKAQLTDYRKEMQSVKGALKDYRKAIRNLIVAVANASGEKLE